MTKRAFTLLTAASLTLLIAWNSGSNLFYFISSFLFALIGVSFIAGIFLMPQFFIERRAPDWTYEDEYAEVEITLKNKNGFPAYDILVQDRFPASKTTAEAMSFYIDKIKKDGIQKFKYKARCIRRGIYEFQPVRISTTDPMGNFCWKQSLGTLSPFIVFPKMFDIEYMPHNPTGFMPWLGLASGKSWGEHNEFFGVREYQHGDSIKRIHWPSSAKNNDLIVKQYEKTFINEISILLDMNQSNNLGFEKESSAEYAIRIAASIAGYFIEQGTLVQLLTNNRKKTHIHLGKGEMHLQKILRELAAIEADGTETFNSIIDEMGAFIPDHSTVIPITVDYEYLQMWNINSLLSKNATVIPVILNSRTFNPNAAEHINTRTKQKERASNLDALTENFIHIRCGENLQEKFRELAWK